MACTRVPLITHNRRHFEHIPEVDLLLPRERIRAAGSSQRK